MLHCFFQLFVYVTKGNRVLPYRLCGGDTTYLLERVNATGFSKSLMEYIKGNGMVIGVSAGSLLFSNNLAGNLGLINTRLDVHCPDGERRGKVEYPLKDNGD